MPAFVLFSKRFYTNKDLITDRFGRLYHLPVQLGNHGWQGVVVAADYKNKKCATLETGPVKFVSVNLGIFSFCSYLMFCFKMVRDVKPDVIIASSDTHFGLIGLVLARLKKTPLVFDVYDDYRVFASSRKPWMKNILGFILDNAKLTVYAGRSMQKEFDIHKSDSIVIENGVDTSVFRTMQRAENRTHAGISQQAIVIGFFGALSIETGIHILKNSFLKLKADIPNLTLLIAGPKYCKFEIIENIDHRGTLPQSEIPELINCCDVVIMPYIHSRQYDVSNPCKLAEYLACGVPMVATAISDIPRYFSDAPEALCIPGDVSDMIRAIRYQLREKKVLPFPAELAWESLGKKLATSLARLCPAGTGSKS